LVIKANPKNNAIIMKIFPRDNFPAKLGAQLLSDFKEFPYVQFVHVVALEHAAQVLGQF